MRSTLVAAAFLAAAFSAAAQTPRAAYVVLGPAGAVARAVLEGAACPAITIDGKAAPMRERAPADERFPLVCETPLPADATAARIGEMALPVLKPTLRRIAVFGDSGCRIDSGEAQPCNDPALWPFAATSAAAAALGPELVIHVGDYLYRERPCPPTMRGCAGSPWGDDWAAWQADFFAPAAKLLAAAPWVVVRGNHENCNRAGDGFFRLLDPRPYARPCTPVSAAYRVTAPPLALVVLDSGEADDIAARPDLVERYRQEFAAIDAPPGSWLLTHRPIWGAIRVGNAAGLSMLLYDNATLQAAAERHLPPGIALVLSGHIHLFEALSFADRRPPQLILGTAGSSLNRALDADLAGRAIDGTTIAHGRSLQAFGVTTIDRTDAGWAATLRNADGKPRFTCTIAGPELACAP